MVPPNCINLLWGLKLILSSSKWISMLTIFLFLTTISISIPLPILLLVIVLLFPPLPSLPSKMMIIHMPNMLLMSREITVLALPSTAMMVPHLSLSAWIGALLLVNGYFFSYSFFHFSLNKIFGIRMVFLANYVGGFWLIPGWFFAWVIFLLSCCFSLF